MNWAGLVLALANGLCSLIVWCREQSLLDAGKQMELAAILQKQSDDISKAIQARDAVKQRNYAVPANVSLPNDGFRRD